MRLLIGVTLVLALGWAGYWWVGAGARERAVEAFLAEQRAAGWVAEADTVRVTGFPNRFDAVLDDVTLADPEAGWAWEGDRLAVLALSYRDDRVIVTFPGQHRLAVPEGAMEVSGEVLRASVANAAGRLTRIVGEGQAVRLAFAQGTAEVAQLGFGTDAPERGEVQRLGLTLADVVLDDGLRAQLDPAGIFPERVERLHMDATATFARAPELPVVDDVPDVEALVVRDMSLRWGALDLRGQGEVRADPLGYAEGELDLRVRDWEAVLASAEAAGAIGPGQAEALEVALGLLARLSGGRDAIEVPLVFGGGSTFIGPVRIGDAPRLAAARP
ncbi:MAG: DUF2125 domain-containing protein [Pseudomonadota bacterium]